MSSCSAVGILLLVGHVSLDRIGRGLVEHRSGEGREHGASQALPLLRLEDTVVDEVPAGLLEDALTPNRLDASFGRDPQQQVAQHLLVQDRGIQYTSTPMRPALVSEPSRRRTHS
jgi:hypothetical protein